MPSHADRFGVGVLVGQQRIRVDAQGAPQLVAVEVVDRAAPMRGRAQLTHGEVIAALVVTVDAPIESR